MPFPIHPGIRMTGSQLEEKPDEMLGVKCYRPSSHPGGVTIPTAASCYRKWDRLQPGKPLGPITYPPILQKGTCRTLQLFVKYLFTRFYTKVVCSSTVPQRTYCRASLKKTMGRLFIRGLTQTEVLGKQWVLRILYKRVAVIK